MNLLQPLPLVRAAAGGMSKNLTLIVKAIQSSDGQVLGITPLVGQIPGDVVVDQLQRPDGLGSRLPLLIGIRNAMELEGFPFEDGCFYDIEGTVEGAGGGSFAANLGGIGGGNGTVDLGSDGVEAFGNLAFAPTPLGDGVEDLLGLGIPLVGGLGVQGAEGGVELAFGHGTGPKVVAPAIHLIPEDAVASQGLEILVQGMGGARGERDPLLGGDPVQVKEEFL